MKLQNDIFQKVFNISEYTSMSREAQNGYDESLKNYNDLQNSLNTAEQDGYQNAEKLYLPLLEKERKEKLEANRNLNKMIQDGSITIKLL